MLLSEFAARAERAGWVTLQGELGERHRDDERLANAIEEDVDALRRRLSPLTAVGQAVEESIRRLRPRRLSIGKLGYEPGYEERPTEPADRMRTHLEELDAQLAGSGHSGALLLYDEAHLLAHDSARPPDPDLPVRAANLEGAERDCGPVRGRITPGVVDVLARDAIAQEDEMICPQGAVRDLNAGAVQVAGFPDRRRAGMVTSIRIAGWPSRVSTWPLAIVRRC